METHPTETQQKIDKCDSTVQKSGMLEPRRLRRVMNHDNHKILLDSLTLGGALHCIMQCAGKFSFRKRRVEHALAQNEAIKAAAMVRSLN